MLPLLILHAAATTLSAPLAFTRVKCVERPGAAARALSVDGLDLPVTPVTVSLQCTVRPDGRIDICARSNAAIRDAAEMARGNDALVILPITLSAADVPPPGTMAAASIEMKDVVWQRQPNENSVKSSLAVFGWSGRVRVTAPCRFADDLSVLCDHASVAPIAQPIESDPLTAEVAPQFEQLALKTFLSFRPSRRPAAACRSRARGSP